MSEKQKLTLSVKKEVVDKAKEMGLNISEITESILTGFTFEPTESDDETLYRQYMELFHLMNPLMRKHNFKIKIGEGNPFPRYEGIEARMEIFYFPDGSFWNNWDKGDFFDIRMIELHHLLAPSEILTNFIEELSNIVSKRKEKSRELEMAKRIIEAITDTMDERKAG